MKPLILTTYKYVDDTRKNNLDTWLKYYDKICPEIPKLIVEQGEKPTVKLGNFLYKFLYNEKHFNKGWAVNYGVLNFSQYDTILLIDNDIIIDKEMIDEWLENLQYFDVVSPYKEFHDVNQYQTEEFRKTLSTNSFTKTTDRYGNYIYKIGGAIGFKRKPFLYINGYDENCVNWGGEDDIHWVTSVKLLNTYKSDTGRMYHLHHSRTTNSTHLHKYYHNNVHELRTVEKLNTKEEILQFTKTWGKIGEENKYVN